MTRIIVSLGVASCLVAGAFAASENPKTPPLPGGIELSRAPEVQIEIRIFEQKKGPWRQSVLKSLCEDSPSGHVVLGPKTCSAVLRDMVADDKMSVTSYPRMVTAWNERCLVRSLINMPFASGGKVDWAHVGTEINVTAKPMRNQQIRCHWDVSLSHLLGYRTDKSPIVSKAAHAADTVLRPGESIAVLCESKDAKAQSAIVILTPARCPLTHS